MCGRHTSNSPECKINNIIEEVLVRKNIRSMIMNNTTPYKKDSLSPPLVIRVRTQHNNIFLNTYFLHIFINSYVDTLLHVTYFSS